MKTDYLYTALSPGERRTAIQDAVKHLKHVKFDAIAFTGISGACVAPVVAHLMDKPLIAVRKVDDNSCHSVQRVEGPPDSRYVIVDDFRSTGSTENRIRDQIATHLTGCEHVGTFFYANKEGKRWQPFNPVLGTTWPEEKVEKTTYVHVKEALAYSLKTAFQCNGIWGCNPLGLISEMYGSGGILTSDMWHEATREARKRLDDLECRPWNAEPRPYTKVAVDAFGGKVTIDLICNTDFFSNFRSAFGPEMRADRLLTDGKVEVNIP